MLPVTRLQLLPFEVCGYRKWLYHVLTWQRYDMIWHGLILSTKLFVTAMQSQNAVTEVCSYLVIGNGYIMF